MHPPVGRLHHVEVWVADLDSAAAEWEQVMAGLGYSLDRTWSHGVSWNSGETEIVIEQSPDVVGNVHERLRPGVNHLAFHAGSEDDVDQLAARAVTHGWSLMFPALHPHAGGEHHYAAFLENTDGFEIELCARPRQAATDALVGGWQTTVHRVGDTVRRSAGPWSASVIGLLSHLDRGGFTAAPRPIDDGFDAEGKERLSYVEGESPQPRPWCDDAIVRVGELIADLHRTARSFEPPPDAVWKDGFGRRLGDPSIGFGHGDLGPWNIMAVDGIPNGFIDWDTAGPMDPLYELAQAAWLNVQLHDDDVAIVAGLGDLSVRARQLGLLLDAYGLERSARAGFVDKMVEVAIADAAEQAREHRVTPQTSSGVSDTGYPFAWGLAWRTRAAAWMLRHRTTLLTAIEAPTD